MTLPIWFKDPSILLHREYILEIWPNKSMDNYNQKVNAIVRLVILLTVVGTLATKSQKFPIIGLITLGVIFQELHRIPLSGIIESKKAHIFTTVQLMCFFILVLTLFLLKDLINLRIIVLVISFVYFFRFLSLSFIFNYVSKLKLNILDLILIFTIYTILFLIIYHFSVFNFNEFLKFIVMLTLSGASLTLFINLNEIKIIKKVMINFFR